MWGNEFIEEGLLYKAKSCFKQLFLSLPKPDDKREKSKKEKETWLPEIQHGFGRIALREGEHKQAIAFFTAAHKEGFIKSSIALADLYRSQRNHNQAIEIYEKALEKSPDKFSQNFFEDICKSFDKEELTDNEYDTSTDYLRLSMQYRHALKIPIPDWYLLRITEKHEKKDAKCSFALANYWTSSKLDLARDYARAALEIDPKNTQYENFYARINRGYQELNLTAGTFVFKRTMEILNEPSHTQAFVKTNPTFAKLLPKKVIERQPFSDHLIEMKPLQTRTFIASKESPKTKKKEDFAKFKQQLPLPIIEEEDEEEGWRNSQVESQFVPNSLNKTPLGNDPLVLASPKVTPVAPIANVPPRLSISQKLSSKRPEISQKKEKPRIEKGENRLRGSSQVPVKDFLKEIDKAVNKTTGVTYSRRGSHTTIHGPGGAATFVTPHGRDSSKVPQHIVDQTLEKIRSISRKPTLIESNAPLFEKEPKKGK